MSTNNDDAQPSLGATANAALGAAGEAAAFIAGAPIAGAADSAIGLGEVFAEREAQFEEAIKGKPGWGRWIWVGIAVLVVVVGVWLVLR